MTSRHQLRRAIVASLWALSALLVLHPTVSSASSLWTATGEGSGVGHSATMPAGKTPRATLVDGTGAVQILWPASTFVSGQEVTSYRVQRTAGSSGPALVCTISAPMDACQDTPPKGVSVTYDVTPTHASWAGPPSGPSLAVTVPA